MQRRFDDCRGAYLTVYLSLVFGIILSLLLALIEGAAAGAAKAQAELVADLGMDSVFAEYHRELLEQYGLFFIDSSYGTKSGGVGRIEQRLAYYMDKNLNPDRELNLINAATLLRLDNPYLETEELSYASDENGDVWKAQAVNYMKAVYGGDIISTIERHLDTVNANELTTRDISAELEEQKQKFDKLLSDEEITEYSGEESEEGYSYDKISGIADRIIGKGMLFLALPQGSELSAVSVDKGQYLSARMKSGHVNKGTGLRAGVEKPDSIVDELIYNEYLTRACGNYRNVKDGSLLNYELEYILCGNDSDISNLRDCAERLFALRSVSNAIYLFQDSVKKAEVEAIALIICTLLTVPEAAKALSYIILVIWAMVEALDDVQTLLDGGKVPLLKNSGSWGVGLTDAFDIKLSGGSRESEGLSYEDYLKIFLALMNKKDKTLRSLDIVEMDIRQTEGNESFRIDNCADYMRTSFGFVNSYGHEVVFDKEMCYE